MLTAEQIRNLKVGDKVTFALPALGRKQPVVRTELVYKIDEPPGKVLVAERLNSPILVSVFDLTDECLSIGEPAQPEPLRKGDAVTICSRFSGAERIIRPTQPGDQETYAAQHAAAEAEKRRNEAEIAARRAAQQAERERQETAAWEANRYAWENGARPIPTANGTVWTVAFRNERGAEATYFLHFEKITDQSLHGTPTDFYRVSAGSFDGKSFSSHSEQQGLTQEACVKRLLYAIW